MMHSGRSVRWASVALGIALTIGGPLTAAAQSPLGSSTEEPYTPAADARDLKAVLFNWMRNMGMLKGHDERDMVASLEYQGTGTFQLDGEPCTLTKYRASTNYQTPSQRIQYTCTRRSGQTVSNIEVVSGLYAWDEDTPGAQIGPTKGKVTPMASAVQERLIRIWASPQGAAKAAVAGTTETFWLGANPGTLFEDGVSKVRETSLKWEGSTPVLTFPLPGVPGATATATLDSKYMTESVVVRQGATTTEFTYGDYQDWNNPLNKIEVFYAGRLLERKSGAVVRDLTTAVTETGNVYVVAPVPASAVSAIKPTAQPPAWGHREGDTPSRQIGADPAVGREARSTGSWTNTDWIGNYQNGGGAAAVRLKTTSATGKSTRPRTSSSTRPRASAD